MKKVFLAFCAVLLLTACSPQEDISTQPNVHFTLASEVNEININEKTLVTLSNKEEMSLIQTFTLPIKMAETRVELIDVIALNDSIDWTYTVNNGVYYFYITVKNDAVLAANTELLDLDVRFIQEGRLEIGFIEGDILVAGSDGKDYTDFYGHEGAAIKVIDGNPGV